MKFFIDAFGDTAIIMLSQLKQELSVNPEDVFVRTYNLKSNYNLIDYLITNGIDYTTLNYVDILKNGGLKAQPDVVLSIFGRDLIPKYIYEYSNKTMNIHPSLLPRFSGCFSVPWCLITGEKMTGVSFHELDEHFDTGKLIRQIDVGIDENDTAFSLYSKIQIIIMQNFISVLKDYIHGYLTPYYQKIKSRHYFPRKLPYDGLIDNNWELDMVERFIRAMMYPPHDPAKMIYENKTIFITNIDQYKKKIR